MPDISDSDSDDHQEEGGPQEDEGDWRHLLFVC